ncbi:MAG TPA: hydroxymethylbilane synthase [Stellaceae bacterium]|nr:hydroxymethylbilane synthase [Stellaceae bacterium]
MTAPALRIGSRGSPLALRQAEELRGRLIAAHPDLAAPDAIEMVAIRTTGDRVTDRPLAEIGGKGLFVKELEEALGDRRIDLAVHSLKDVPAFLPEGFALAAHLPREDARDALIARHACSLAELPRGASVGTSSPRRQAQLLHARPDLVIVPLRGNVDTRLAKIAAGAADATILALAGLKRLDRAREASAIMSAAEMLPAATQGVIAVEIRADDARIRPWLAAIDHHATALCASAERALLETLNGDCRTPIAAMATLDGDRIALDAMVLSRDGKICHRLAGSASASRARDLGREIGAQLLALAGPDLFGTASHPA